METEVIMKRKLFDSEISQKSQSGFFSATDLVNAGNRWRTLNRLSPFDLQQWLRTKQSKEFIDELKEQFGEVYKSQRGRGKHTWVHPYLFIDIALAIDPKLKIEVYRWIYDELLKYRNDSGNSYKKMCGALYENCANKSTFHRGVAKTAQMIQSACHVKDWQKADENQLKLRDKIHENIALLCDVLRDNNQAIRIGILKAIELN
jgi:hypothetical protein